MVIPPKFLVLVRRFLIRAFHGGVIRQALSWLSKGLAFSWTALFWKLRSLIQNYYIPPPPPPPPPQCPGPGSVEKLESLDGQGVQKLALAFDYVPIPNGKTVSLQDIMPSVYPHAGDGMHSAVQSSRNLELSRSAHSSAISLQSRHPPRQSFNGSRYTGSMVSSSNISVNIIAPQDSPISHTQNVAFIESAVDTRSNRLPYLQPINTTSQSLLPPMSKQSTIFTGNISPVMSNKQSGSSLRGNNEVERQDSLKNYERSVHSGNLSATAFQSYHPGSPTDDGHSIKSFKVQTGYQMDDATDGLPYHTEKNRYENLSHTELPLVLGNLCIVPIMPEAISRYVNRPIISKARSDIKDAIQPLTKIFDRPRSPNGWTKYIHPEGACYFFNPVKRVYAEANLHDESVHSYLMEVIALIENFIAMHDIKEIDNDTELVIHLEKDSDGQFYSLYYYVHHKTRSIFFLDEYGASNLFAWSEINGGASSESHLGNEIETQYWFHCQFFPHSSTLTKEKVQELRDVVMHYIGDTMTSPKGSTAPYSLEELRNVLALTNDMDQNVGGISVGTHSCFARLMFIFCRARFLHFHGEPHARIDRTTSVYGDDVYRRTWLVKILSPILFCAPNFLLQDLQSMWVDEIVHKSVFRETMETMSQDWDRIVLFATVMLNANVAFLAIQSVDNSGDLQRSAAQIASYVSMITSIGGIVIGLLLSRQNRTKLRETVNEFEKYMSDRHHPTLGLETLAILYSLPYALLMWGMIFFLLAVTFLCFMHSDPLAISIVGVSIFFCVAYSLWCVYTNWEKES